MESVKETKELLAGVKEAAKLGKKVRDMVKDGVDASVRILGQPDQTVQNNGVADDIFKDENNAAMACLAPWYTQVSVTTREQAYISDIRWTADTYFKLPYDPTVSVINYDGIGQFYHKIPKSAFLWNLLEAHVSGWNRSVPLAQCQLRLMLLLLIQLSLT